MPDMRWIKAYLAAAIILAGIIAFSILGNNLFAEDENAAIHVGTDATYPPFEFLDGSGHLAGFDIEIMNALCDEMKVKCVYGNEVFNQLIPDLVHGKFDAIISALGASPERRAVISLTDTYYVPTAVFVAPIARHYSMGDITGKTIAVQKGSTFEDYLYHRYKYNVTIKSFESHDAAFNALKQGKVDLLLSDSATVKYWLGQDDNAMTFGVVVGPLINAQYFGGGFAIGVRKDDANLLNDFNKALLIIKSNGVYDRITKKYFGN